MLRTSLAILLMLAVSAEARAQDVVVTVEYLLFDVTSQPEVIQAWNSENGQQAALALRSREDLKRKEQFQSVHQLKLGDTVRQVGEVNGRVSRVHLHCRQRHADGRYEIELGASYGVPLNAFGKSSSQVQQPNLLLGPGETVVLAGGFRERTEGGKPEVVAREIAVWYATLSVGKLGRANGTEFVSEATVEVE